MSFRQWCINYEKKQCRKAKISRIIRTIKSFFNLTLKGLEEHGETFDVDKRPY